MDWIHIIQAAIKMIEAELGNPRLSPKKIAQQVHVSESHFTRAFYTLTGFTLSEYIRNRRLTVAAELIKSTDLSILDISCEVGYESTEAFSKAYKRFHGVAPSNSKELAHKSFYPLQIKLVLTQEKPLQWAIEHKESFYLCGKIDYVPTNDSNATNYLWAQCETKGYLKQLYDSEGFQNLVGVSTTKGYTVKALCHHPNPPDSICIPSHRWAVFTCEGVGAQGILKTWDLIYSTWLPKAEYDIVDLPQLEVYSTNDFGYTCEIWIAIA